MSALHIFWLASISGALLFFMGGYFTAKWMAPKPAPVVKAERPERLRASPTRDYDGIVSRVASREDIRSVALADEQGLPIAGRGENQDGLAAISGLLLESAAKAKKLVPFGSVMAIHVECEAGTTVNAYPVAVGGNEIVLATLSVGPGPDQGELRRVLQEERTRS